MTWLPPLKEALSCVEKENGADDEEEEEEQEGEEEEEQEEEQVVVVEEVEAAEKGARCRYLAQSRYSATPGNGYSRSDHDTNFFAFSNCLAFSAIFCLAFVGYLVHRTTPP